LIFDKFGIEFNKLTLMNMNFALKISLVIALLSTQAGCDQIRSKIGSLLQNKTPQQANEEAMQALDQKQPQKAIELTNAFLENPNKADPDLLYTTARAYAETGNVLKTITLLDILVASHAMDKPQLMADDNFDSIKTDIRFVSWIADVSFDEERPSKKSSPPSPPSSNNSGASAEINSNGVSARAGNVSVKIAD